MLTQEYDDGATRAERDAQVEVTLETSGVELERLISRSVRVRPKSDTGVKSFRVGRAQPLV